MPGTGEDNSLDPAKTGNSTPPVADSRVTTKSKRPYILQSNVPRNWKCCIILCQRANSCVVVWEGRTVKRIRGEGVGFYSKQLAESYMQQNSRQGRKFYQALLLKRILKVTLLCRLKLWLLDFMSSGLNSTEHTLTEMGDFVKTLFYLYTGSRTRSSSRSERERERDKNRGKRGKTIMIKQCVDLVVWSVVFQK